MALDPLPTPFASTVLSGQGSLNQSATASSTGDLATANSGAETIAGLNASTAAIAVSGSVVGSALANLNATATSISGSGDADAGDLVNAVLYGIDGNGAGTLVSIAGSGSLQGTASATTIARATSVDGNSDASARLNIASGLRAGDIDISGNGTIAGAAQISQAATARTTAGSANADSQLNTLSGISVGTAAPSLLIDGVGSLLGTASLISDATAVITGDSTTDSATASQRIGSAIGLDANGSGSAPSVTRIGGPGSITGQAEVLGTATASATTGSTNASAGVTDSSGSFVPAIVGIRPGSDTPLEVQGSGLITAAANGTFTARATTGSGGATANADGNVVGSGVEPDFLQPAGRELLIGGNGVVNASASLTATAVAATIDGAGSNASATLTNSGGYVAGLNLGNDSAHGGVLIEGSGSINATARLTREASAATLTGGNAQATITNLSGYTSGIDGNQSPTVLRIQGDTGQLTARGQSDARAIASSGNGNSVVQDVDALKAYGMKATQVNLGGATLAGMLSEAQATQNYQARSINGTADVTVDNTKVVGALESTLQANGSFGTAVFRGDLVISVNSESTSGPRASTSYSTGTSSYGMVDTPASFAGSGSLQSSSRTDYSARATNVTGNADAFLAGSTEAIKSGLSGPMVSIGGDGSIDAVARLSGGSNASSVEGNASSGNATSLDDPFVASGIAADATGQTITIAGKGDITASAGIGSEVSPLSIQSRSVSANATSTISGDSFGPRATGITGKEFTVQAAGGSIQSEAVANILLSATSVNGDSTARNTGVSSGSELFKFSGVNDANLTAGGSGSSNVTGRSHADLLATSQSTLGNATSSLGAQSAGIASPTATAVTPQIKVSGNSSGIAELASTTLSRSVRGIATSTTLNSSVIGIDDYLITAGGNSTLKAQATSNASATATSISGNAISQSIL